MGVGVGGWVGVRGSVSEGELGRVGGVRGSV